MVSNIKKVQACTLEKKLSSNRVKLSSPMGFSAIYTDGVVTGGCIMNAKFVMEPTANIFT